MHNAQHKYLPAAKPVLRETVNELAHEFIDHGGEVLELPEKSSMGMNVHDWKRLVRGLKVATPAEITAERDRRTLIAITNGDAELVIALTSRKHDAAIKFDIENDRIDPETGAIRNTVSEEVGTVRARRAVRIPLSEADLAPLPAAVVDPVVDVAAEHNARRARVLGRLRRDLDEATRKSDIKKAMELLQRMVDFDRLNPEM